MIDSAELADWTSILSLIFGGCMANAISLEQCTVLIPTSGSLITLAAFVGVTLCFLPSQLRWSSDAQWWPRLRLPHVPLRRWAVLVAMFFSTNLMNNLAFAFQVPMPIHIIFRSGGLVINMVIGYTVAGKTYNATQVLSVLLVSGGITLTTLAAGHNKKSSTTSTQPWSAQAYRKYTLGIGLLVLSLIVSGFMGLWQERTFAKYGRKQWKESLFYTHFLALPLFLLLPSLRTELQIAHQTPTFYAPLVVNALTQIICIAGVNRLTTRVTSVSVVLILAVRKAASMVLSVAWAYARGGTVPNPWKLWAGTVMVLGGTVAYARASSSPVNPTHDQPITRTSPAPDQLLDSSATSSAIRPAGQPTKRD